MTITSTTLRRARIGAAALAVTALVTITGCAEGSPGVVAYVGDNEISNRQLTEAVDGVGQALGEGQQIQRGAVVDALVRGEVAAQIAEQEKITITDADRSKLFSSEQGGDELLANEASKAVAYDLADESIVVEKLGVEKYLGALKAADVKLNPRFGVWNPDAVAQGASAVENKSASLSTGGSTE